MAVRSTNVVHDERAFGAGSVSTLYTVPADRTLIVKDMRFFSYSGVLATLFLFSVFNGETGQLEALATDANGFAKTPAGTWFVLREGATIELYATAATTIRSLISGALLEGDPS